MVQYRILKQARILDKTEDRIPGTWYWIIDVSELQATFYIMVKVQGSLFPPFNKSSGSLDRSGETNSSPDDQTTDIFVLTLSCRGCLD
jgi:hypothetical protein